MLITPKTVAYHGKKVPRIATAEIMINNLFFHNRVFKNYISLFYHKKVNENPVTKIKGWESVQPSFVRVTSCSSGKDHFLRGSRELAPLRRMGHHHYDVSAISVDHLRLLRIRHGSDRRPARQDSPKWHCGYRCVQELRRLQSLNHVIEFLREFLCQSRRAALCSFIDLEMVINIALKLSGFEIGSYPSDEQVL